MNRNKHYCVSKPKQWLVNVWQTAAAERYWCSHQQVDKATDSVHACRWTTFWTLILSFWQDRKRIVDKQNVN